ncbi:MAG: hypothetical protein IJ220_08895 [Clostridia bacterium]|nr:hypothetical protein [Clostridia bacterium]
MWIGVIVLLLIILIYYVYGTYFKEYFEVKKVYETLQHVLDTRDVLLLKLSGEKINKKEIAEIVMLIDERKKTKNAGYTVRMNADVALNHALKNYYPELVKVLDNPISKEIFKRIMDLEKQAKKIRIAYNDAVEKYNANLILHKKVCMRLIRMKPLDTYSL